MLNELDQELIKKCYEDRCVEIKGTIYKMHKMSNDVALDIIGHAQASTGVNDLNWKAVQKKLFNIFSIDDVLLSRKPDHFEENPSHYFTFMSYAIAMVAYPFQPGS